MSDTLTAVILAGGFGTRMRPLTLRLPKPMLPLVDRPFSAYQLEHLAAGGVTDVVFSLGYKSDALIEGLSDASRFGLRSVSFEVEEIPLDTAGAARWATRNLGGDDPGPILVCNGDVLTDLDLPALIAFHDAHPGRGTITLTRVEDASRYGLVRHDATSGRVEAFLEKPVPEQLSDAERAAPWINAGTYVIDRGVLEDLPIGEPVSIERSVFPAMVDDGLYGFRSDAYWLDMGTLDTYLTAHSDVMLGRVATKAGEMMRGGVHIDPSADVAPAAQLSGAVYVGPGAVVEHGATLVGPASVGAGARIGEEAVIDRSVVLEGARVGGTVRRSIVGQGAEVASGASVSGGSAVGPGARVLSGNILDKGVRVGLDVTIPEGGILL
jgi:mannose-1-phosphate guanylyltransferase